jgi:hypothetical protein
LCGVPKEKPVKSRGEGYFSPILGALASIKNEKKSRRPFSKIDEPHTRNKWRVPVCPIPLIVVNPSISKALKEFPIPSYS